MLIDLPSPLDKTFANKQNLLHFFDNLVRDIAELLNCDRCYLYLRDPKLLLGQIMHCYCANSDLPHLRQKEPQTEPYYLAGQDPLFAAALAGEPHLYIDDIQELIQKEKEANSCGDFWQQNYDQQYALIQGHIFLDNKLWGILQVAQFKNHRPWSRFDRDLVSLVIDRITPLATVYVQKNLRHSLQYFNDGR